MEAGLGWQLGLPMQCKGDLSGSCTNSTMWTTLATSLLLFFVASLGTMWAKIRCVLSSKLFEVLGYRLCRVSFLDVCSIQ